MAVGRSFVLLAALISSCYYKPELLVSTMWAELFCNCVTSFEKSVYIDSNYITFDSKYTKRKIKFSKNISLIIKVTSLCKGLISFVPRTVFELGMRLGPDHMKEQIMCPMISS